jgi:tRNA threonylcarbamoyladenosine biosynthesis protein TsaB
MMARKPTPTAPTAAYLLTIETSGLTCGAALSENGELLAEMSASIKNLHSRVLTVFVQQLLDTAGLKAGQLSAICLSAGPGSFTGLRIGYSVAKGLAHALCKPLIEVPTLDVWVYQAGEQPQMVAAVMDAHRGEIFGAFYRWHAGELSRESESRLYRPEAFLSLLNEPVLLVGPEARQLAERYAIPHSGENRVLAPQPPAPQAWALASLGHRAYIQGAFADLADCEPLYLRSFKGVS